MNREFLAYAKTGDTAQLRAMLDAGADPATENSRALQIAAANGHVEIVDMLLEDRRAEPAALESVALRWAVENGHTVIVHALLRDGRADPGANDCIAFGIAAGKGYTDIVHVMLRDPRVDPAAFGSTALWLAAENGHTEVVRMLLDNGCADPNGALYAAAIKGHVAIVRALLADPRTDPADENSRSLYEAAYYGQTETVLALLEDGRAEPADLDHFAILSAMQDGYTDIVRALLRDGRAIPTADESYSLGLAARYGHVDVVFLVLAAMGLGAGEELPRIHEWFTRLVGYQLLPTPVAIFLRACKDDPTMPHTLNLLQALLRTNLPTQTIIALAYEGARRNMSRESVLQLEANGTLTALLHNTLGPNAEIPATREIQQHADLAALAGVSKAEPILRMGQAGLDLAQYPDVIAALAPTLRPEVANAVWQTLRAQARGEERSRAYGTPAERVRDRIASKLLLTAVVSEYNAFAADAKQVAQHHEPHLSAAANRLVLALTALSSAVERSDTASIKQAQRVLQPTMQTYEERVKTVLGEAEYGKRAQRLQLVRSIIHMPAEQVAEFSQIYARGRTSRKGHAVEL
ncbi:MAG TPA: ankyrin repeat domain-containing protein [Candidatus Baltobacteraceae bacterium]|nr:ankyrin repeat domain-containing protein [Candidatus Baltobacteraceae bacterium]